MSDAAAEFWRFSIGLYGRPGVAPACLVLQDEHLRDVNLALYCCWLGVSGRGRITRAALDALDRETEPWRQRVVVTLRAARRAIKDAAAPGSESLYAKAKAVELEAERLLQTRLAAQAPAPDSSLSAAERLAAAAANLALYVGEAPVEPIREALALMAKDGFATGSA